LTNYKPTHKAKHKSKAIHNKEQMLEEEEEEETSGH
jgi:hypothetical protein